MVPRLYVLMTILSLTIIAVDCQTFQYSNGWINGKRGGIMTRFIVHTPSEFKSRYDGIRKLNEKTTIPIINCDLQKLRTILQGNNNDKFYLLPCGHLNNPEPATDSNKASNQLL